MEGPHRKQTFPGGLSTNYSVQQFTKWPIYQSSHLFMVGATILIQGGGEGPRGATKPSPLGLRRGGHVFSFSRPRTHPIGFPAPKSPPVMVGALLGTFWNHGFGPILVPEKSGQIYGFVKTLTFGLFQALEALPANRAEKVITNSLNESF